MKERARSATPPAVGGGMAVPSLVCWPKPPLLPGRHFPLDAPGPTEDRDRERGCSRERSVITEETHTCSEHYGQGGRKSGKWDVEQGSAVRGGGRAASVGRESQGDKGGSRAGHF